MTNIICKRYFLWVSSFQKQCIQNSFHGKEQMEKNRTSREQQKYLILQLNYRTTVMHPITLCWRCLKTFHIIRVFYVLPLSSLLPSLDIEFATSISYCLSVTMVRQKSFSEKPPIPNWTDCSFNPKNSVTVFKFEYSCMFVFVDQNPATVTFDCNFFAFWKNTHCHFYNSTRGWTLWINNVFEILQREVLRL